VRPLDLTQEVEYRYRIGRLHCKLLPGDPAPLHHYLDRPRRAGRTIRRRGSDDGPGPRVA
jgi:hypothetical protein